MWKNGCSRSGRNESGCSEVAQEGRCDEIADTAAYGPSRVLFQSSDGDGTGSTEMIGADVLEIVVAKGADNPVSERAGELIVATDLCLADPTAAVGRALSIDESSGDGINLRGIGAVHAVAAATCD